MSRKYPYLAAVVLTLTTMSIRPAEAGKPSKEQDAPPVAAPTIDAQLDMLASQILESLRVEERSKSAVAEFPDLNGDVTEFGQFVAEELITRLYRSGSFQVVERRLLNKVIAEQELSLTGPVDSNSAQKLGRLLGVDAIATGSITELGEVLKLNARLISTETEAIFAVASVEVGRDEGISKLFGKRIRDDVRVPATPKGNLGAAANAAIPNKPLSDEGTTVGDDEPGLRAIERMTVALGGAAKFAALEGYSGEVVVDAKISGTDSRFAIAKSVSYPDNIGTMQKTPFGNITRVVAGCHGWTVGPGGTRDLEANDLKEGLRDLRTDMFGILRNPGAFKFQALAQLTIDGGKICLPVHVTCADEDCGLLFLDPQTDLPMTMQRWRKWPVTGEPATQKWYIDEYTNCGRLLLPGKGRLTYNDEEFAKIHVSTFTANPETDPALFVRNR